MRGQEEGKKLLKSFIERKGEAVLEAAVEVMGGGGEGGDQPPSHPCSRVQEPQVCLSRQPLHTITQQLDIGKVESCLKYSELTY